MDSYQNKMVVLTNCMNAFYISAIVLFSWCKKKLAREKYCFYYQRTTNSTRRENENETLQKAGLDLDKLVCGGRNLKKT